MASQILSGSSNVSYTNNTGQNVRVVINYMAAAGPAGSITISWAGVSVTASYPLAIGRNLAFNASPNFSTSPPGLSGNNAAPYDQSEATNFALPTELMLAPGQTFSATCGAHNIVVIPEAG